MRLWTLHPYYLDPRGLGALWRKALLAQAMLAGQARGYLPHPQLHRLRESATPLASSGAYLQAVHAEAVRRGYRFDATKIGGGAHVGPPVATCGQLDYEWAHLRAKRQRRAPQWLASLEPLARPGAHPLFRIEAGPMAAWEVTMTARRGKK